MLAIPATRRSGRILDREHKVFTDGSCNKRGDANAKASSRIWFGPNNNRNRAILLPKRFNTNNAGELMAVLYAVQTVPKNKTIQIYSDSQYIIDSVTKNISKMKKPN